MWLLMAGLLVGFFVVEAEIQVPDFLLRTILLRTEQGDGWMNRMIHQRYDEELVISTDGTWN